MRSKRPDYSPALLGSMSLSPMTKFAITHCQTRRVRPSAPRLYYIRASALRAINLTISTACGLFGMVTRRIRLPLLA